MRKRLVLHPGRVVLTHKGVVHSGKVKMGSGSPALLLDDKRGEYPIRGLTKQMKMVNMSGGAVMKIQPVKKPIKILL